MTAFIRSRKTVFSTPWFQVIAKLLKNGSDDEPYYSLRTSDYVTVVAVTPKQEFVLVRQYRPSVERFTLELPSGTLLNGESPKASARRELLEETGYEARTLEYLGTLKPDTGRLSNKLRCYFAKNVRLKPGGKKEPDIQVVKVSLKKLFQMIKKSQFDHALNNAVILLAVVRRKLEIPTL